MAAPLALPSDPGAGHGPAGRARILVLGAGPAGVASAILLGRLGHAVTVLGTPRAGAAWEGVAERAVDGLRRLGCARALALLDSAFERVSAWGGRSVRVNREFVVARDRLDAALVADLVAAGVTHRAGRAASVGRGADGAWRVERRGADGVEVLTADFLVEARGSAAPRRVPDAAQGPRALALARGYRGCSRGAPATVVESFAEGWAWCARDAAGEAVLQLFVAADAGAALARSRLGARHAGALAALPIVGECLGGGRPSEAAVGVRAVWPRLRGALAGPDWIRVGDAAASCDPLSGHGLFEALAGAWAAAPVVNTLLAAPSRRALAVAHYAERIGEGFAARRRRAAELYAAETRWPGHAFWQRGAAPPGAASPVTAAAARFVDASVAEDGFIVTRRVVRCADHPRGLRFLGAVDLARLQALLAGAGVAPEALAAALAAPCHEVLAAWRWLAARGLAGPPPGPAAAPVPAAPAARARP